MKFVKGISLFIVYPLMFLGIGFYAGLEVSGPGMEEQNGRSILLPLGLPSSAPKEEPAETAPDSLGTEAVNPEQEQSADKESVPDDVWEGEFMEAAASGETLCVDTVYVLEETDILRHTVVETTQRLPDKYVGMNREQFVEAMEVFEAFPPLSEMERGFVNLEVTSFSRERVVVKMNYKYVQPSESFYLAVYNNEVVVYLEDRKTIYIETEIKLDSLPEQLQHDIIQMMWVENEEKLYNFLENYSS